MPCCTHNARKWHYWKAGMMDENAIHQWLIDCFGQIQGEMAWNQIQAMPDMIKDQLFGSDVSQLPKPSEVQAIMKAFTANAMNQTQGNGDGGQNEAVNLDIASSIALSQANDETSEKSVNATTGAAVRQAMTEANLWLDSACGINPAPGEGKVFTRADWVNDTLDSWAKFTLPVARSTNEALAAVLSERFGDTEISGIFAGPIPISLPDGMKSPSSIIKLLGTTAFSMQLGHAAGVLSHEVRGSFDQGIAFGKNPAGGLIAQNAIEYAKSLNLETSEVLSYLALQEVAHARLFANVPWLMPRFEALIGKYARGVNIDLDAVEEQLRDAATMDPESISGAVDITKVAIPDTPEQTEALHALETLMALVEGWVDAVTWKAGMAHVPHIEQLREMTRRQWATGGPAEQTFKSLIGLELRPKRMREAAALWERIGSLDGIQARDEKWGHPDLLPSLADGPEVKSPSPASGQFEQPEVPQDEAAAARSDMTGHDETDADASDSQSDAKNPTSGNDETAHHDPSAIDWDAELDRLLEEEQGHDDGSPEETNDDTGR